MIIRRLGVMSVANISALVGAAIALLLTRVLYPHMREEMATR